MEYAEIMVRYGELSTKGKNKRSFISRLARNVKKALEEFPEVKVHGEHDRMHLYLNGAPAHEVMAHLKDIFGIQTYSPVLKIAKDPQKILAAGVALLAPAADTAQTFKVNTKRSDHHFVWDTNRMNMEMGGAILDAYPTLEVKMKKPTVVLRVEIRSDAAYLSYETLPGAGGLPVGSSGRGMLMLSGGIDSPVAGYLAMKRGVEIEAVHFASPPYTAPQALQKAKDLTAKLAPYVGSIQFIEVPFSEIQEAIKQEIPEGYLMTITRRMMMRITEEIRKLRHGLAIINGESLGQVASQTLPSMIAINAVTTTPVIRPVVTMDKSEIIEIAQKIDTFELSIQPFEDCCTIFAPTQPKTKPKLEKAEKYEMRLAVDELVARAVAGIKVSEISRFGEKDQAAAEEEFEDLL